VKIKTKVKAGNRDDGKGGYESDQHNQTMAHSRRVKTAVRAGIGIEGPIKNHNQTVANTARLGHLNAKVGSE
jgi:hypothetical protein